jgi:type III secretion protein C
MSRRVLVQSAVAAACAAAMAWADMPFAHAQSTAGTPARASQPRHATVAVRDKPGKRGAEAHFVYRAEGKRLSEVLQDFAASQSLPVIVADGVEGVVNANFDTPPENFLKAISKAYGILWYHDGTALYFYPAKAIQSRLFRLKGYSRKEVVELLDSLGLGSDRYPLKFNDAQRTLLVYGPPRQVELVASALDSLDMGASEGNERVVRVFPLRFAAAGDRVLGEVTVPGIATTLRSLYAKTSTDGAGTGESSQASRTTAQKMKAMQSLAGGNKLMPELPSASHGTNAAVGDKASQRGMRSPVDFDEDQPSFEPDDGINAVIVQGRAYRMREYEALVRRLDQKPVLVELEAMIIDVSADNAKSLGVDWSVQGSRGSLSVTSPGNGVPQVGSAQGLIGAGTYTIGTLVSDAGRQLMMRVNALQGEGKARIVAKPSVLGVVNRPAVMKEKRVATVRVAGNLEANLFQIEAGTLLQVTPQVATVDGANQIKLSLYIEDGSFESASVDQVPVVKKTEIRTEAYVKEGESLLIGGLIVEANVDQESGVPGLRSIPLLGGLFRWKGSRSTRTERLFLITPKLVGQPSTLRAVNGADAPAAPAADAAEAPVDATQGAARSLRRAPGSNQP